MTHHLLFLFVTSWTLQTSHREDNPVSPVENIVLALPCTNGGKSIASLHAPKPHRCPHSQFPFWCADVYMPMIGSDRDLISNHSCILMSAEASTNELQWDLKPWFICCPAIVACNQVIKPITTQKHSTRVSSFRFRRYPVRAPVLWIESATHTTVKKPLFSPCVL